MKRYFWLSLLLILILSACRTEVEPTLMDTTVPSKTVTATATPSATLEPTMTSTVTRTPWPTKTPTITPIPISSEGNTLREGEELPELEPITKENIDQLQLLSKWGAGVMRDACLTPDEKQIVTATSIGIYWLDSITLEEKAFLPYTFTVDITLAQLSPSTDQLAIIEEETGFVWVASTKDGSLQYMIEEYNAKSVWFTPDDEELFIAFGSDRIAVWSLIDQTWTDKVYPTFFDIAFSPTDSTFLAVELGAINLYDENGLVREVVENFGYPTQHIDWSSDGRYIAMGIAEEQSAVVYDMVEDEIVFFRCLSEYDCVIDPLSPLTERSLKLASPVQLSGMISETRRIHITENNKYLIVITNWGFSNWLFRFNLENGSLISKEEIHESGKIFSMRNSKRYFIAGNSIDTHYVYDDGVKVTTPQLFSLTAWLEFSPDGSMLGVSGGDEKLRLYDINYGTELYRYASIKRLDTFAFFHHESKILIGSPVGTRNPVIWDYRSDEVELLRDIAEWGWSAESADVSFDDSLVYFFFGDYGGVIYSIVDNTIEPYMDFSRFHPSEAEILMNPTGRMYTVTYGEAINWDESTDVGFSCSDWYSHWDFLASGNGYYCFQDDELSIIRNDSTIDISTNHAADDKNRPVFTLDDSLVFIYGYEGKNGIVYIYDTNNGEQLAEIKLPDSAKVAGLSPDGKILAIATYDGIIRLWGIPTNP